MPFRQGETHHRARYSDEIVERARSLHEQGFSPQWIAATLDVSQNTLNDWIYYRTRIYTKPAQEPLDGAGRTAQQQSA